MTYSLGLSFTRFFNKFSHDRQEKKNDKSTVQKFEYLKSERCFFGKLKAVVARRRSVRKGVLTNFVFPYRTTLVAASVLNNFS